MVLRRFGQKSVIGALAFAAAVALPALASASSITVTDTKDWNATTTGPGVTVETFTEANPPSWSHSFSFSPAAQSFTAASIAIRHEGNRANGNELWLMFNSGAVQIGTLTASSNSTSGNAFILDTFNIPTTLFPSFPAGGWTLVLRLEDNGIDTNNDITLDYATLSLTYDDTVSGGSGPGAAAVPEPGTLVLFGSGMAALAVLVRSRRRA